MKLPLLSGFARTQRLRRTRAAMRGYRLMRAAGRMQLLSAVMATLTTTALTEVRPSRLIFGAAADTAEIAVRQYLMIRVMGSAGLNTSILKSIGRRGTPVVHPLPREWRAVLRAHGFTVAEVSSAVLWWGYVLLLWAYGVQMIGKLAWQALRQMSAPATRVPERYAYFVMLAAGQLPAPAADGRSYDIVSWYAQWSGRAPDLGGFCHSVPNAAPTTVDGLPVLRTSAAIPPLQRGAIGGFIAWGVLASVLSLVDTCRGRWWSAVMLSEAAFASLARRRHSWPLAADYLFHASNVIYRPLWTYEAERRGSAITFYFYSTNSEAFKAPDGYTTPLHSWQLMTWPRFLVWDEWQADFIRRAIGPSAGISVVGPIWFHNSAKDMPDVPAGAIAVFDVQPQRVSRRQMLGTPNEFYTEQVALRFLRDILEVAAAHGRTIAFKRKRHIGAMLHKGYAGVVERLSSSPSFVSIDPDISAVRVIAHCAAVISMPFTSTALLAGHAGKPSIYYDPVGLVQKDDRASHGVSIVTGRAELEAWFRAVTKS